MSTPIMWGLDWSDPQRKTVGEHRAKKEKTKDRLSDKRNSTPPPASRVSLDSPLSIFGSRRRKGSIYLKKESNLKLLQKKPSGLSVATSPLPPQSMSVEVPCRGTQSVDVPRRPSPPDELHPVVSMQQDRVSSDSHGTSDSDTVPSLIHDSATAHSPSSEIRLPLESPAHSTGNVKILRMSQESSLGSDQDSTSDHRKSILGGPPSLVDAHPSAPKDAFTKHLESLSPTSPTLASTPASPINDSSLQSHLNQLDAWRAPGAWDQGSRTIMRANSVTNFQQFLQSRALEFVVSERDLLQMKNSSPTAILGNMETLWQTSHGVNLDYKMETAKHFWMLSIVENLDVATPMGPPTITTAPPKSCLVLYDTPATVSYIACLQPESTIYDACPAPLKHEAFLNVHGLTSSSTPTSFFRQPPAQVDMVHSIGLQSFCPQMRMPKMLKHINKCLQPGGVCHLTLIDPMPRASTMGRHLQAWLERNLLVNLARNFKCMSPGYAFPQWLGQASMRAPGSKATTVKFYAMAESIFEDHESNAANLTYEEQKEIETKAQIRSLAGRTLWMETWGPFVTADKWWWEDAACVDECLQLGTIWEYHLVKGIKE